MCGDRGLPTASRVCPLLFAHRGTVTRSPSDDSRSSYRKAAAPSGPAAVQPLEFRSFGAASFDPPTGEPRMDTHLKALEYSKFAR
jgi:hypothetical protein